MEIRLSGLGKRFNREWVFTDIHTSFNSGKSYAIKGPNGSGKSTLLQIISGFQLPSEGTLEWWHNGQPIPPEEWFNHLAICTPYMELIEDFTLEEHLNFHFKFKPVRDGLTYDELIRIAYFEDARNKQIRHFSSGMKQRLKLLLALFSDVPVVLLDEPTTNMDQTGIEWYLSHINKISIPLIVIASNQLQEIKFCDVDLTITEFKNTNNS